MARDGGIDSDLVTALLSFGGFAALAYLSPRRGPGVTVAAEPPPAAPPAAFPTLQAVDARFTQLREAYRMGILTPEEAISQAGGLQSAAASLLAAGMADPASAAALQARLADFTDEVARFIEAQAGV